MSQPDAYRLCLVFVDGPLMVIIDTDAVDLN